MKIKMFILFFVVIQLSFSATPPGTNVGAVITPSDSADVYPTHNDIWGLGGYRVVADTIDRNAISTLRRKIGMVVYCISDSASYQLRGGITNGDWVKYSISGPTNYLMRYSSSGNGHDSTSIRDSAGIPIFEKPVIFKDTVQFGDTAYVIAGSPRIYSDAGLSLTVDISYPGAFQIFHNKFNYPTGGVVFAASDNSIYVAVDFYSLADIFCEDIFAGNIDGDTITADVIGDDVVDYAATSTVTGWSSFTNKVIRYQKSGKVVTVWFEMRGTSNLNSTTFTLPFVPVSGLYIDFNFTAVDNGGSAIASAGFMDASVGAGDLVILQPTPSTLAWTASGTKCAYGQFTYFID